MGVDLENERMIGSSVIERAGRTSTWIFKGNFNMWSQLPNISFLALSGISVRMGRRRDGRILTTRGNRRAAGCRNGADLRQLLRLRSVPFDNRGLGLPPWKEFLYMLYAEIANKDTPSCIRVISISARYPKPTYTYSKYPKDVLVQAFKGKEYHRR